MDTIWQIEKDVFRQACMTEPKYKALAHLIEQSIHRGELQHQQKLPAQRLLADRLVITHGTVTRAYDLLEKKGLVSAKLGAGTYVNLPSQSRDQSSAIGEYDFASSMQPMLGQQMLLKTALIELAQDLDSVEAVMTYAPQGMRKHKQIFKQWLGVKGIALDDDDLVFTQGAQQGIYTCLQILTEENDYVMHEELAYPGFFRAVDASGVRPLAIPLSAQGLDLTLLEDYCEKFKPKLLYITPNLQNPTNVQYSQAQLDAILSLSREYDFFILEDDVNYCLSANWRLPLQQQDPERVFYLSSLSKYVAGGLRVAYSLVPEQWQQRFNANIHSQCWMVSTLNFELAARFITAESFIQNQLSLEREMQYRQQAFQTLAKKHDLTAVTGGLNLWLQLPSHINVNQFNQLLLSNNIKVRTADVFLHPKASTNSANLNSMRISLGGFNTRIEFENGLRMFERSLEQIRRQQDVII